MRRTLLLALCITVTTTLAFAGDPPARVARLSYLSGQVSIQPNGVNDWVQASINRPMTSSDRIWADTDGRAELQMGGASLRLDSSTSLTLVNVSDNNVQLELDQGTAILHVTDLFDGEVYEVDTPNIRFIVQKRGDYRLDVDNAGDTTSLTVFRGRGEVTGDGPALRVDDQVRYTFTDGRSLRYTSNHNPGVDGFDEWAFARAKREDDAVAARYVSRYAVGYSDLDDYGYWESVPTYGHIWYPRTVVVGWAPYRYGHWVWVGPWGWTWVDDAPWGFAPFHYGRWVYYRSRWGWCPGPYNVRPIYAPALVGWIGGARWGVGLSFGIGGGVGWFPLGWGEPYIPYYAHSRRYFEHVNVWNTHIRNINYITNTYYGHHDREWNYAYGRHGYAVTAVSNDVFRTSRPTRGAFVKLDDHHLREGRFEREVALRPTTNSVLGPHAGDHSARPPVRWERPDRSEHTSVADREHARPDRIPQRENAGRDAGAKPTWENGRPNRAYPHPPERGNGNAVADNERPRGIPGRAVNEPQSNTNSLPARVPRPPQMNSNVRGGRGDATGPVVARPNETNTSPDRNYRPDRETRSVTRPQDGQISRPITRDPMGGIDRQPAPRVNEERNVPRPTAQPVRPPENRPAVTRDMRPESAPVREARPPRSEAPARAPEQHAAPQVNRPAQQERAPREQRKVERENNRQQSQAGYPRPTGAVRAAGYNSFATSRSYDTRSYNSISDNYSATPRASHSYSEPRQSYSQPTRSYATRSYSAPARVNTYSAPRAYSQARSHSYSAPSRSYSAPSRSYSAPSRGSYSSHASSQNYSHSGGVSHGGGSHNRR